MTNFAHFALKIIPILKKLTLTYNAHTSYYYYSKLLIKSVKLQKDIKN